MQGPQRRLAALACVALALALVVSPRPAAGAPDPPPELPARAWILVDASDGEVLAAHRAASSYPVASTTKLMTALVARHDLRLGETVTAPAYDALPAESLLGLQAGERIEVRDLLTGMLLVSGNDAAEALAEAAAGSVPAFVAQMNRKARRLGLDDTSYANPIGLDDPGNYSSAEDLARLAIRMRSDRLFRRIFASPDAVLRSGDHVREVENRNALVGSVPGINGVKTGYTLGAGYVLVGSATRKGVTLVSAVLGASSEAERDGSTVTLLDYGFSRYQRKTPVRRGERLASASVRYQGERLPLIATKTVALTVRKGQRLATSVAAPDQVEGPIERGERLGKATVRLDGDPVGRVPLVAGRPVDAATILERYDAAIPGSRVVAVALAVAVVASIVALAAWLFARRRR